MNEICFKIIFASINLPQTNLKLNTWITCDVVACEKRFKNSVLNCGELEVFHEQSSSDGHQKSASVDDQVGWRVAEIVLADFAKFDVVLEGWASVNIASLSRARAGDLFHSLDCWKEFLIEIFSENSEAYCQRRSSNTSAWFRGPFQRWLIRRNSGDGKFITRIH